MNREEKILLAKMIAGGVNLLSDAGFKLLIRARKVRPAGLITAKDTDWIDARNTNRELVKGLRFDGCEVESVYDLLDKDTLDDMDIDTFEEHLDYLNPDSDKIEECAPMRNGISIMTCRDTFSTEDDPANFTWLMPKSYRESKDFKDLENKVEKLRGDIRDKENKIEELKVKKSRLKAATKDENEKLEEIKSKLEEKQEELRKLRGQNELYEKIVPQSLAQEIKEGEKGEKIMEKAEQLGAFEGEEDTPIDQVQNVMDKLSELSDQKTELEGESEVRKEVREMKSEVADVVSKLEKRMGKVEDFMDEISKRMGE